LRDVRLADDFWGPRLRANRAATLQANLRQCERVECFNNFALAAGLKAGRRLGRAACDSDAYKILEAIAYLLAVQRDAALEKRADAFIDLIAAAQQKDGYLNTYFTVVKPKERWKDLSHSHELYCAGHLIEAGVAYHQATGKRKLLDVACKFADHIGKTFGPSRRWEVPGHQGIELALVKLYRATGEKRYLALARFFVDARGRADRRRLFGEYAQDHKPVRAQAEAVGHAVRAMYLYCAMADLAEATDDKALGEALEKIWADVVGRKMYVTGGIGTSARNEGFTTAYDLPNDSAYAETCAAIGLALWNHRMFLRSADGRYADVLERASYNGVLSGVSLTGDRFFYTNPLASTGKHHRVQWFGTPCCPTNVVRYLAGMGERAYAQRGNAVWAVLYLGGTARLALPGGKVELVQRTRYPWDGDIEIRVNPAPNFTFDLNLRIPGWCGDGWGVTMNGAAQKGLKADKGYVRVRRAWEAGDVVRLSLPMPVRRVYAHPRVKADVGRVALQRGPLVYCLEGVDNGGQVRNLCLECKSRVAAEARKDLLGGVTVLAGKALAVSRGEKGKRTTRDVSFVAVPYYAWDNRKPGPMTVWLAESPELAELPGEDGVLSKGVIVRASHFNPAGTLTALNDGVLPRSSGDHTVPRMTWWDHKGGREWVSYQFPAPRRFSTAAVYWFDDTGRGGCRAPAAWRLLWRDGDRWRPVKLTPPSTYGTALDRFNTVRFEPVTTRELRLEATLKAGFSAGILEWRVAGPK
jgi:DUF1680 family protein